MFVRLQSHTGKKFPHGSNQRCRAGSGPHASCAAKHAPPGRVVKVGAVDDVVVRLWQRLPRLGPPQLCALPSHKAPIAKEVVAVRLRRSISLLIALMPCKYLQASAGMLDSGMPPRTQRREQNKHNGAEGLRTSDRGTGRPCASMIWEVWLMTATSLSGYGLACNSGSPEHPMPQHHSADSCQCTGAFEVCHSKACCNQLEEVTSS